MKAIGLRVVAASLLAVSLAACGDIYGGGGGPVMYPGQVKSAPVWGVEEGSVYGPGFNGEDRRKIADAAGSVLYPGGPQATKWGPTASGKSGTVSAGAPFLVGLDSISGGRISAPAMIETNVPLGAASDLYRTSRNTNVRTAPNTNSTVLQTLPIGTLVRAYGTAQPEDWYLIGRGDEILGYAYGPLLVAQGEGDPILAGGAPRRPRLCRDLNLSLITGTGEADRWTVVACNRADGSWEVTNQRGLG